MKLRNKRPYAIEIPLPDDGPTLDVAGGGVFDVADPIAGHAPSGTPGEDGYDPGDGLLAQVDNYEPADPPPDQSPRRSAAASKED